MGRSAEGVERRSIGEQNANVGPGSDSEVGDSGINGGGIVSWESMLEGMQPITTREFHIRALMEHAVQAGHIIYSTMRFSRNLVLLMVASKFTRPASSGLSNY